MKNDFLMIFFVFLLSFSIISLKKEDIKPKQFDPYENAAEIKTKIWYDPDTKEELAAHGIITKSYKKFLWFKRVVDEGWDVNMTFAIPLKLANGKLVTDTIELPYYIK